MEKHFTPYYCEASYVNVVLPSDEIHLDETQQWLIIGYPGVDGIDFRTKAHDPDEGVYAYYPIENEYRKVADSSNHLIQRWKSNDLIL